ncbi:MAG: Gfo/Idh/MocA family oxidoreductase [Pedosphaera sp.]|nr:Gfo/Idh/MocA family oxidoreductase [Pedosphaera sp.]
MNSHSQTRRRFLQRALVAGIAFPFVARRSWAISPNERIRHVSFGAGGMAGADLGSIAGHPSVDVIAAAEIDSNTAASFQKKFPKAKAYADWRELLDKEGKHFDTANVSTPDHMHAPIAMSAMQLGKHVYVQKPLTHEVFESRRLREFAKERGLVTQMGIQVHSDGAYRTAVAGVQSGAIGKVKSVHTWSNKKWGDTTPRPDREDPLPTQINWDHWCGAATKVPYLGGGYYHPGNWRKRLAFGTGTFGDMGCHIYDPVYKALALTAPLSLRSEGPAPRGHNWAINARIKYVFPATAFTVAPTVEVTWYDGDEKPPQEIAALLGGDALPGQGSILIGTEGVMLIPHVSAPQLYPKKKFVEVKLPAVPGANHWHQFIDACRGKGETSAGFDYSGLLTEAVLLGGIATHFPNQTLEWNAAKLTFANSKDATALVRREYRKGWEVAGL